MPTKSKRQKTYNHPALVAALKRHGACPRKAAAAIRYASKYKTLESAVRACRNGEYLSWASYFAVETRPQRERAMDIISAAYSTGQLTSSEVKAARTRWARRFAIAWAVRTDRAVARTRKAAKTRAARMAA